MTLRTIWALVSGLLLAAAAEAGDPPSAELARGFTEPPAAAQPRAWWHWMNGNVTQAGITQDLEWMKRVGIGGMQLFDGSLGVAQYTDKRLVWMSPPWQDAFRHAAREADRLGLEMSMAASGGWSESGGPSVTPAEAMKKLVWSETDVRGPLRFHSVLTAPPGTSGPFQSIPRTPLYEVPNFPLPGIKAPPPPANHGADPSFYADAAVVAYRVPADEAESSALRPKLTASAPVAGIEALGDGDLTTVAKVPMPQPGEQTWLQWEFPRPFHAHALSVAVEAGQFEMRLPRGEIQASDDGQTFTTLASFAGPPHAYANGVPVRTFAFPAHSARFFRVVFAPLPQKPFLVAALGYPRFLPELPIREIGFAGGARVHRWEDKAGFGVAYGDLWADRSPPVPAADAIRVDQVVNLTGRMRKDGTLDWKVPPGDWRIVRLGYSITGQPNGPATPEATGLEVDKLNRAHVLAYVRHYVGQISGALGPLYGKSFRYFLMDSWEAGAENWTDDMVAQFRTRRGYDPTPYLPVLLGRVVESAEASEGFLWDFRRTLGELLAENHYRAATDYFHERGIGLYAEAMGVAQPAVGDGLLNKGMVDIPMGEFWTTTGGRTSDPAYSADIREAASAAHIYGKPFAAAESFTSDPTVPGWAQSPAMLKPIADRNFALGINRIVFHTSAHQPFVDDAHKPGITLFMFGQHYTRNITWAEQAVAWNTYLARTSYLLQQGQFVGDIAYFYGEGAPSTVPFWKEVKPAVPDGYSYDFVNQDVLLHRFTVRGGRITLPDGMSYRVLVIPEDLQRLSLATVRKLRDLVAAGSVVVANKPTGTPSLGESLDGGREFRKVVDALWGTDGAALSHDYGRGRIVWGKPLAQILESESVAPDLEVVEKAADTKLVWLHRHAHDADIYFVSNQLNRAERVVVELRARGSEVELWRADTGEIEQASYDFGSGRTRVPLQFDPNGAVFIVLRKPTTVSSRVVPVRTFAPAGTIEGPWQVTFPPNRGAPASITLPALTSWSVNDDAGVRYFSGTATYEKDFDAPAAPGPGSLVYLDLGEVHEIAELTLNGVLVGGILWKPPFRADVTGILRPGTNHLSIRVTNLWPNRMIGDQQPGEHPTYTFTDIPAYRKDSKLLDSGLIGPVSLSAGRDH